LSNAILSLAAWAAKRLHPPGLARLYRLGPITVALRRLLNRAAPDTRILVEVAAGGVRGARLWLDLQKEKDYWLGSYELDLQEAARTRIQPGWVIYDIGANIGYLSLLFARLCAPGGRVIAIEALPDNSIRLQEHSALNPEPVKIEVIHAAVLDRSGPVEFFVHNSGGMGKVSGSAGRNVEYGRAIQVDGVTLDELILERRYPPPSLIKIDVEGGEALVLTGMKRTLQEYHPLVFLELHGEIAAQECWNLLTGAGYRLSGIASPFPPINHLETLSWKSYLLATPEKANE